MSAIQGIGQGIAQGVGRAGMGQSPLGGRHRGPDLGGTSGPSFADTLKDALGEVQQSQDDMNDVIGQYLRGEPVELHQVTAAAEEAGLALEMLVEIRNKITEAYRSVIQMQS